MCAIAGGCGNAQEKAPATQVAAKVNSTEITVYQVNSVLARTPNVTPAAEQRVKREILDNLVDQELARQQAVEKKLDRSAGTLLALEASKREILARAFAERIAMAEPKPTPQEIKQYHDAHPALFAQRRVFSIEEVSMPAQPGLAASLREQAAKGSALQDVAAWLKARQVQFTANSGVRAAEQIPIEQLDDMQSMKDGESRVFEYRGGIQVIRIAASKAVPVDEATAAPRIQKFLMTRRSAEAIAKEMKQVREVAKIEYVGEFTVTAEQADAKAKAQLEAKAKVDAAASASAATEASARAAAKTAADAEALQRADALAKARTEAEEARRVAEAKAPPTQTRLPSGSLEKGVRGL
jgi:EpsD family peptidyl-prolyl cis-trans isomerase